VAEGAEAAMPLDGLQALVVLSARRGPLTEAAHVALPLADWAETDGTFTNRQGMVQRVRAAIPPAGDGLPGWEILSLLADRLGKPMELGGRGNGNGSRGDHAPSARRVFLEAREKLEHMKGADWGPIDLPPFQLRFAKSRG